MTLISGVTNPPKSAKAFELSSLLEPGECTL